MSSSGGRKNRAVTICSVSLKFLGLILNSRKMDKRQKRKHEYAIR